MKQSRVELLIDGQIIKSATQGRKRVWQTSAPMVSTESVRLPLCQEAILPRNTPTSADRMMEVVNR